MNSRDSFAAVVEAEEFAGGPMTPPPAGTLTLTKSGQVVVTSRMDGSWHAACGRCGAGCGAAGAPDGVDLDTDELDDEHRRLEAFIEEHRSCCQPLDPAAVLPSPAAMPTSTPRKPTVWVVKGASGGDVRILAERHFSYARPEGEELRFFTSEGDGERRVATVRPGSWHWVVAEAALNPKPGEQ